MLFIDVVQVAEKHERVSGRQKHSVEVGFVALLGLIGSFHVAIPFLQETGLDLQVEHVVFFAVIPSRMVLQLAALIVELEAVDGFGGQAFLQNRVVGKELLAVYQDAHGLVHPVKFAILLRHARQLLDEFLQSGSFAQVEGGGVKHHRVAAHHETLGLGLDHGAAQKQVGRLQSNIAQLERVVTFIGTE